MATQRKVEKEELISRTYHLNANNINTIDSFVTELKKKVLKGMVKDPATGKLYPISRTTVLQRLISQLPAHLKDPEKFLAIKIK